VTLSRQKEKLPQRSNLISTNEEPVSTKEVVLSQQKENVSKRKKYPHLDESSDLISTKEEPISKKEVTLSQQKNPSQRKK
jgi:hypothetical protein